MSLKMSLSVDQIKSDEDEDCVDLDNLLVHLGQFGKFQKRNYLLICLVVVYSALPFGYVFTTRNSEYRCFIEGCDDSETPIYNPSWLHAAIPNSTIETNKLKQCSHFQLNEDAALYNCDEDSFNQNHAITCNRFVFENGDATIERDFNITCDDNLLKLTMVGTMDNLGELFFLPLSGFISDRLATSAIGNYFACMHRIIYGRRTMMVIGVLASTVSALIKSFTSNYESFLIFEFLETCLGCGTYSAAYILAVELVPPEKRVLASTVISCAFALGEALLGTVAWLTGSWRLMLQILYIPGILFIFYFWLVNESVRWLLSRGNLKAAKRILLDVAIVNRTAIPEDTLRQLGLKSDNKIAFKHESFWNIFKSSTITIRLVLCSLVWISCVFVYYGFTLHAVAISGNLYFNFIAVSFIEIPAYFVSHFTLDVIGRKKSLCSTLIIAGGSSIAFIFVPEANNIIRLILFLIGKFSVTIAFTTLYMYTTELFPTTLRHQLLSTCSTCGRLGSMVAPQIPLLIYPVLPMILFGIMATFAAIISLTFPETLNTKLPDTIDDAEHIQLRSAPA